MKEHSRQHKVIVNRKIGEEKVEMKKNTWKAVQETRQKRGKEKTVKKSAYLSHTFCKSIAVFILVVLL